MRELFRRMTPKGELVVSVLAWGSTIAATLRGPSDDAPKGIGADVSPIEPPTETTAGWFTHTIGAHPGVTVSITEAEHELIAALSDPEPKADADSLAWVRRHAFENRAKAGADSLVLDDMRVNGTHLRHLRVAIRRELAEAYAVERERLRTASATAATGSGD